MDWHSRAGNASSCQDKRPTGGWAISLLPWIRSTSFCTQEHVLSGRVLRQEYRRCVLTLRTMTAKWNGKALKKSEPQKSACQSSQALWFLLSWNESQARPIKTESIVKAQKITELFFEWFFWRDRKVHLHRTFPRWTQIANEWDQLYVTSQTSPPFSPTLATRPSGLSWQRALWNSTLNPKVESRAEFPKTSVCQMTCFDLQILFTERQ